MKTSEKRREYLREYLKRWRENNKERTKEYNHNWYKENGKSYYQRNWEKIRARERAWGKTKKGKELQKRMSERACLLRPEKVNARRKLQQAVRSGKMIRQPCEKCGTLKTIGHHEDYSKPFKVNWLCDKHHRIIHGYRVN